jgi:esterase/lipase
MFSKDTLMKCTGRKTKAARLVLTCLLVGVMTGCSGPQLRLWHTVDLTEEFTRESVDADVKSFEDYLLLEERLYTQLSEEVYKSTGTGPEEILNRYSRGSAADPSRWPRNWNRSFELSVRQPKGGVLLLHGMSDSPYSLRALGQRFHREGYRVLGLRLPGHGTAPSGLRYASWLDMAAAVGLALDHLEERIGDRPLHIIGYSTGAALALNATLEVIEQNAGRAPDSLVLISPAIRVHSVAGLANFKNTLAGLPGLDGLAYLNVMNEFDPFKYNSFATNAGAQVHEITLDVDRRIRRHANSGSLKGQFPPVLVFKSTVDDTVTTAAVVDNLLLNLSDDRNELVLFDINRNAAIKSTLLIDDPGPLTLRLMEDPSLPFGVTFVTNRNPENLAIVAKHKSPKSSKIARVEELDMTWPRGVISLSHIALPFLPDDPLYGATPPLEKDRIYLGNLAIQGERGLLKVPENWLLRLRFNPFYSYLEDRSVDWVREMEP